MDSNTDMPLLIIRIILKSSKAVRRIKAVPLTSTSLDLCL